ESDACENGMWKMLPRPHAPSGELNRLPTRKWRSFRASGPRPPTPKLRPYCSSPAPFDRKHRGEFDAPVWLDASPRTTGGRALRGTCYSEYARHGSSVALVGCPVARHLVESGERRGARPKGRRQIVASFDSARSLQARHV